MTDPDRPIRTRRRPAVSCQQCRRRKIKCDRSHPCNHCQKSNKLCDFPEDILPLRTAARGVIARPSTSTLSSIPTPSISASSCDSPEEPSHLHLQKNESLPVTTRPKGSEESPELRALLERVQTLEKLLSERIPAGVPSSSAPKVIEPCSQLQGTFAKTRYFGSSHWMNSIPLFGNIVTMKNNSSMPTPSFNDAILASNVPAVLKRCKAMARISKKMVYDEWLASPDFRASIPSPETCEILLNGYFRTSESLFRILHVPTFRSEYNQYKLQPNLASDSFILKMLLAMAIGVTFYQGSDFETLRNQAKKWVYAAQSWLSEIPHEKSRLTIAGIQIHCLLLLARQSVAVVEDQVGVSTGALVRRAFFMGLHRDPRFLPRMSVLEAEMRRRLWATITELDVQFSVDSGMKPLICVDDFDTEAPANINDEDVSEDTDDSDISRPKDIFTQTSIQIILLSSSKIRIEILRACNALKTEPSYEEISRLGEIIRKECRANSSFLRIAQSQNGNFTPTQLQCNLLDIYIRRFILILHWPLVIKSQDISQQYFCRKKCLDTAVTMASYTSNKNHTKQSLRDQPLDDDYTSLKIRSASFFDNVLLQSTIIVYFELITQLRERETFLDHGADFRQPLKTLVSEACELLAARIAVAENNAKGHLLFSAALGHVEAIESFRSPFQGAVEGAERSAEICSALLTKKMLSMTAESQILLEDEMNFGTQDWSVEFLMPDSWLIGNWNWNGSQQDECI